MMKKTVMLLSIITTTFLAAAYADDADILRQFDIRTCQSEAKERAQAGQPANAADCQCKIDNTNYQALAKAKKKGDIAKVQQIKGKARKACAEKM